MVRGDYFKILYESYKELFEIYDPVNKDKYINNWQEFDKNCFEYPETIGKCVHLSMIDNKPIGLWSYDPRNWPKYGIVGENCIIPEYRRSGYGKRQIEKMLKIFKENRCQYARVTTSENDFFIPAQKNVSGFGIF